MHNVTKHEFVGTSIEVVGALNQSLIGLRGKVVDETRNTFVLETARGEKKVLKRGAQFQTNLEQEKILIAGDSLMGRAEDRLKK